MSRGLNKVMIIGRLGRDPEMRYTPSGRPVTTFTLATSRTWNTADGERRSETEWFNVVAWGNLAEICKQHLVKGQQVYVEGRLQTRKWQGQDGQDRYSTEIIAEEMHMLGSRSGGTSSFAGDQGQAAYSPSSSKPSYQPQPSAPQSGPGSMPPSPPDYDDFDDDIPF